MRILGLAAVTASMLVVPQAAEAAVTTLDFSGAICGVDGDAACGNGTRIGQNYGDSAGVDVSHASYEASSDDVYEPFVKYWGAGYGDLDNAVWGGGPSAYYAEFTFAAKAGYEVRLLSFDAACYLNRASCQTLNYVVSIDDDPEYSGGIPTQWPGHADIDISSDWTAGDITLRWGPDSYDTGLDNIAFEWRQIRDVGGVPEPATWAMMILGFGLVGAAARQRRLARRAA
jgi:hypothetical protein